MIQKRKKVFLHSFKLFPDWWFTNVVFLLQFFFVALVALCAAEPSPKPKADPAPKPKPDFFAPLTYSSNTLEGLATYPASYLGGIQAYTGLPGHYRQFPAAYNTYSGVAHSAHPEIAGYSTFPGYSAYQGVPTYSGLSGLSAYNGVPNVSAYSAPLVKTVGYNAGQAAYPAGYSAYPAYSGLSGYHGVPAVSAYSSYPGVSSYSTPLVESLGYPTGIPLGYSGLNHY